MRKPILLVFAIVSVYFSCTKIQTTELGAGLIPPVDGIITKDTLIDVFTNNFVDPDFARVYKTDDHVIGTISNDPLFGKTTASAFFELKPVFYKYFFPGLKDSLVADSAVLILSYRGVYGDTIIPQTLNVFEINQSSKLKYDSAYATTDVIGYGALLGQKTINLREIKDSVKYGFELAARQIRIPLSKSFATRFIKDYDSADLKPYASDDLFRANFAGFGVVPGTTGQSLIRINLSDTNTKLALFYNYNTLGGTRQSVVSYFRFNLNGTTQTSGSANIISRQRTGSQVASFLSTNKPNDSLVFIQTSPGTYANIRIPGLATLPNSIIHRADLIMEQIPDADDKMLTPPRYLLLTAYDSVNKRKTNVPNDYVIEQTGANVASFGGFLSYKETTLGRVGYYDFNLTRYVQGIVTRKDTSYNLRLYAPSNDSIAYRLPYPSTGLIYTSYIAPTSANYIADGRVRLGGGDNKRLRMRLRIIYSRL